MKKFYIIDVSNMFYRAFWGTDPLTTSYGQTVQGIHGFISMLEAVVRDNKPDYIALALESDSGSFRKDIDPTYKANRSEPNPDLKSQLEMLPKLLKALNYPTFRASGLEADDVIGGLATQAIANPDVEVVIVSSDKDFSQLVNDRITIFDSMKGKRIGQQEVFEKYGVRPDQFVDYLAIVGDSSDNVKGVEGVGPKGAMKLLNEYGSLKTIYDRVGEIKGATKEKLINSTASAFLAQKLVKIQTDMPFHVILDDLTYKGYNKEELVKLFTDLELRQHMANFFGQVEVINGLEIGTSRR